MTVPHERLREWIISKLDEKHVFGLEWSEKDKMRFKVIWLHQRNGDWREEFGQVFMEWAIHTGKYRPGKDEKNYTQWKTTLRNALHKCEEFKEVFKSQPKAKPYPYKIYEILDRKRKRPKPSRNSEPESYVLTDESSSQLPVILDDMSSPHSSLASPAQQVPGTQDVSGDPNIEGGTPVTTRGQQQSPRSPSSMDQLEPSQELKLSSTEFQKLMSEIEATDPSNCTIAVSPDDVTPSRDLLEQAVLGTIMPGQNTSSTAGQDPVLMTHSTTDYFNVQTINDPLLGEQHLSDNFLNQNLSFEMTDKMKTDSLQNPTTPKQPLVNGQNMSLCDDLLAENSRQDGTNPAEPQNMSLLEMPGCSVALTFSDLFDDTTNQPFDPLNNLGDMSQTNYVTPCAEPFQNLETNVADDDIMQTCQTESFSKWRMPDSLPTLNSLEKYTYPAVPDHICASDCNLFLELLYQGHKVKTWDIVNPSGCRVNSQVNQSVAEEGKRSNIDIAPVYGPENRDTCELPAWPEAIKLNSHDKVNTLLQGLRRGFLIDSHNGNINVTRFTKVDMFYSSTSNGECTEITRHKESDVHQAVTVFDYDHTFLRDLGLYESGTGPKPCTGVYIRIGQKTMDESKLLFGLRVTSCKALQDVQRLQREKDNESLSIRMQAGDSLDKVDSLLTKMHFDKNEK